EARRQVERNHRALRSVPSFDSVQRPGDGRLYLLSDHPPAALTRRFALWSWAHLVLFFAAIAGFVFFLA
ncbi:MAG TPA: hypothetical protein VIQ28_02625, partial [Burkholderiales bacterium]